MCVHILTDVLFFTPILNPVMSVKQRFLKRFASQEEGHELRASGRIKKQKTVITHKIFLKIIALTMTESKKSKYISI